MTSIEEEEEEVVAAEVEEQLVLSPTQQEDSSTADGEVESMAVETHAGGQSAFTRTISEFMAMYQGPAPDDRRDGDDTVDDPLPEDQAVEQQQNDVDDRHHEAEANEEDVPVAADVAVAPPPQQRKNPKKSLKVKVKVGARPPVALKTTPKTKGIAKKRKTAPAALVRKSTPEHRALDQLRKVVRATGGKAPRGAQNAEGAPKKARRFRPGTKALREINALQKTTNTLIPKTNMTRLLHEILSEHGEGDLRLTKGVKEGLHQLAEYELIKEFQCAQRMAIHAGRITIKVDDMRAANDVRFMHPGSPDTASRGVAKARMVTPMPRKRATSEKQRIADLVATGEF